MGLALPLIESDLGKRRGAVPVMLPEVFLGHCPRNRCDNLDADLSFAQPRQLFYIPPFNWSMLSLSVPFESNAIRNMNPEENGGRRPSSWREACSAAIFPYHSHLKWTTIRNNNRSLLIANT